VPRRNTRPGVDPLGEIRWEKRRTVISNPDGTVVFQMDDVEIPAGWSQLATDIVVSKYFRKAGVPASPGHETSVRQVVRRLARTIRRDGEKQGGYFASREDADAFEAELTYMLVNQIGAFNSPVVVQLRPPSRVRHRRFGRKLLLRSRDPRRADHARLLLASAGVGLLHPVGGRRPHVHLRARAQ
jgi:hypothetical protein